MRPAGAGRAGARPYGTGWQRIVSGTGLQRIVNLTGGLEVAGTSWQRIVNLTGQLELARENPIG